MTPTPEEIALAKEIADKFNPWGREGLLGATWLLSYYGALGALVEAREKAAHHLFALGEFEAYEAIHNGEYLRCQ